LIGKRLAAAFTARIDNRGAIVDHDTRSKTENQETARELSSFLIVRIHVRAKK